MGATKGSLGEPGGVRTAAVQGPMDVSLIVHQGYRPRHDSSWRWYYVRRDTGEAVTSPRSEYLIAQRDICKVVVGKHPYPPRPAKPKYQKMSVPVDEDDLKHLRKSKVVRKRELRWDNPDDRMALKYREVCRRLERTRGKGELS